MTRLILTTNDSGAASLKQTGIADIVIPFGFRFVRGPLPSDAEFAAHWRRVLRSFRGCGIFIECISEKAGSPSTD
jgi:hypothetical protein